MELEDIIKAFGRSVRKERTKKEFTQQQLALEMGMCTRTIGEIEAGASDPRFRTVILISQELRISLDAILYPDLETAWIPKCVAEFFADKSESDAQKYIDFCKQADLFRQSFGSLG